MTLVEALRTRLLGLPPVTAEVAGRVYAIKLPQSPTLPALVVQQISRLEFSHLRGVTAICRARVQVDAITREGEGDAYDRAHALAAAVHGTFAAGAPTGLAGFKGLVAGVQVTGILPADQRETYEAAELKVVKVSTDYIVWFAQWFTSGTAQSQ